MLNLRKVLDAKPKEHVEAKLDTLYTPWGEALDADHVWEEHPDPSFERETFQTLNGRWSCAFVPSGHAPTADLEQVTAEASLPDTSAFDREIVVPFSPEAPLSGVNRQLQPDELLWYRRTFATPELGVRGRCLLHFQAVDYACAVRVNGELVGTHAGGYVPFAFDVTDALEPDVNELLVCVADPSEFGGHVRGKQRFDRGDIWYTAQSGIWQSVWMEIAPEERLAELHIEADPATGILVVGVRRECSGKRALPPVGLEHELSSGPAATDARTSPDPAASTLSAGAGAEVADLPTSSAYRESPTPSTSPAGPVTLRVYDEEGELVASGKEPLEGESAAVAVHVGEPHLWSPEDPYLYRIEVVYGEDAVQSYCAFRLVEMRVDEAGHPRVFLNGEPLFIRGVLDQAYWSDGLMTAPCDEALVYDIEAMRAAGFNLMRKHIKVENARWYYHCDSLGMLVLQDMVSGGDTEIRTWDWSYKPTLFKFSWNHFRDNAPSHQERLGAGSAAYREEWTRTCRETVRALRNHPSIIGWSLFNEGWGQFDARAADELVRKLDPTRVIDAVSGWYDQGCGDFSSVHNYFRTLTVWPSRDGRAFLISEFGGFSHRVEGHSSLPECYGYEVYEDLGEWRAAVRALLDTVDALEARGLAGYIYTQVSDIEEETNGLLTYDRRVNKLA